MPLRTEYSCRLKEPEEFQKKSFRRISSGDVDLIIARPHGRKKTRAQAIRYPRELWDKTDAKRSCKKRQGTFEPVKPRSSLGQFDKEWWEMSRTEFESKQPLRIISYRGTGRTAHMVYEIIDLGKHGARLNETNPTVDPQYTNPTVGFTYKTLQDAVLALPANVVKVDDFIPHRRVVGQALKEGKPVPAEVLRDYPDLIPQAELHRPKSRPLPPDTQNVQTLSFDSELFACYSKQTKRGFRAYCRRK